MRDRDDLQIDDGGGHLERISLGRGLDAFKNEIRAVIPEAYKWTRPKRFFWEGIWDDIVNVAGK